MHCPFCDKEVIEKQKIGETDHEYIIHNIRPANKGQCIVIPKRHINNLRELEDNEVESLLKTVKKVSKKLKDYLNPTGFNYGFNEGQHAGQSVEHFHFHILPRFKDDTVFEHHIFHRKQEHKRDLSDEELLPKVKEFKKILQMLNQDE